MGESELALPGKMCLSLAATANGFMGSSPPALLLPFLELFWDTWMNFLAELDLEVSSCVGQS